VYAADLGTVHSLLGTIRDTRKKIEAGENIAAAIGIEIACTRGEPFPQRFHSNATVQQFPWEVLEVMYSQKGAAHVPAPFFANWIGY